MAVEPDNPEIPIVYAIEVHARNGDWEKMSEMLQKAMSLDANKKVEIRENSELFRGDFIFQMGAVEIGDLISEQILILDEATEGLSPLIQKEIWNVLVTLKKSGLSIIIVDKSLEKLSTLADHFYFLVKGKIAWNGKYDQLNDKLIKLSLIHI